MFLRNNIFHWYCIYLYAFENKSNKSHLIKHRYIWLLIPETLIYNIVYVRRQKMFNLTQSKRFRFTDVSLHFINI